MIPLAAIPVLLWSLATDDGGFLPGVGGVQWEWAVPTSGPGGADAVWATRAGGNYLNDASDTLEIPVGDLTGLDHPVLTVRHWYDIQPGDAGRFEIDDGTGWAPLLPIFGYPGGSSEFTGASGGWVENSLDLRGFGTAPRVRMVFEADPSVSAAGWYIGEVALFDGDVTAPEISPVQEPVDTEDFDGPYPVRVQVLDDTAVTEVALSWTVNALPQADLLMTPLGNGIYEALIPGRSHLSVINWQVQATDGEQTSQYPEVGQQGFTVALRSPTDFGQLDADGRQIGNRVAFGWTPPTTMHTVDGYRIRAVEGVGTGRTVVDTWWVPADRSDATVSVSADGPRSFDLVAEYVGFGPSEPTDVVDVVIEAADLTGVFPDHGYQGETVRVRLTGDSLYLSDGDRVFFDGILETAPLEVETVSDATVVVTIPPAAATGAYGLTLVTEWGSTRFDDVFTVRSGDEAPRILSIAPGKALQGEAVSVTIEASEPFAGPVFIDADEELLLVEDPVVEGATLTADLVIAGSASPGTHTLILDDGSRLWEADLVVEERVYTGNTGCGGCNGAPDGRPFAPWLLLMLVARRRR